MTAFAGLLEGKTPEEEPETESKLAGRTCCGTPVVHSLDTLDIDLMQYTCECYSCDVLKPREGSRSPFSKEEGDRPFAGSAV